MFAVKIADVPIAIEAHYAYMEQLCAGYVVAASPDECAFTVSASQKEIAAEESASNARAAQRGFEGENQAYFESLALYRKICMGLVGFDAFLFHSAVLEYDGRAYAFAARSGTGKSTHVCQWVQALGDKVRIINGDKPIIRYQDGGYTAYGTPFNGKEGWGENASAPLAGVCFIERGQKDELFPMTDEDEMLGRVMQQILMPFELVPAMRQVDLMYKLIENVPFYLLKCTPTPASFTEAFKMTLDW